jgi:hypothetical protein
MTDKPKFFGPAPEVRTSEGYPGAGAASLGRALGADHQRRQAEALERVAEALERLVALLEREAPKPPA